MMPPGPRSLETKDGHPPKRDRFIRQHIHYGNMIGPAMCRISCQAMHAYLNYF